MDEKTKSFPAAFEMDSDATRPPILDSSELVLKRSDKSTEAIVSAIKVLGWVLTLVMPFALYTYLNYISVFSSNMAMFISITSIPLVMWLFNLHQAFVAPLLAILLLLLAGLAPPEIILSGFSSNSFILSISILGLGCVIVKTGLSRRYSLWLLNILPENSFFYQLALFFTGLIFTPVVPSIPGRTSISAPVLGSMINDLDEKTTKKNSAMLYSAGLDGTTFLSAIFLTGAPANLFIYGLLPAKEQQAFQFTNWVIAASVTGGIMLILYFLISWVYFRAYGKVKISKGFIVQEIEKLGPVSHKELMTVLCIIFLAVGIVTTSIHKIEIPFIAFSLFIVLVFLGILSPKQFKTGIDWPFLFLLGSVIGVVATMKHLNIDDILVNNLSWLGVYMRDDFRVFILLLTGMIIVVRFFLPMNTTNFIFASALIPLASAQGVNPWLIGFCILLITETSFFNYQSPHIQFFRDAHGAHLSMNEAKVCIFRAILLSVKLSAIYLSFSWWEARGIL